MKWKEIQPLLPEMRNAHLFAEQIRRQGGSTHRIEADQYIEEHAPFDGEDALEALEEVEGMLEAARDRGYREGFADGAAGVT